MLKNTIDKRFIDFQEKPNVMNNDSIIRETELYINNSFKKEGSGHDWWHISRVRNLALKIGEKEKADLFLVELAALLHDLDDWKLNKNLDQPFSKTKIWLAKLEIEESIQSRILKIIEEVSYKGAGVETKPSSLEAQVVQDADRLDAIGAIGIARTFAYGGHKNRLIYDPNIDPEMHASFEDYQKSTAPTINHFYEKLLLLKDRMNTPTACKLAAKRHQYMEKFLNQFYNEWRLIT